MELIKKTICLNDFRCKLENNWGSVTGLTSNNAVEYFVTGATGLTSNLLNLNILFIQKYDDIGVLTDTSKNWIPKKTYYYGEVVIYNGYSYRCYVTTSNSDTFNLTEWENNFLEVLVDDYGLPILTDSGDIILAPILYGSGHTVNFVGESKIDEFRRYSKTNNDIDLYNPKWNSGYTQEIKDVYGNIKKIISESTNYSGTKQNLYEYVLGATEGQLEETGIHYRDISNGISEITYNTDNLTPENSIISPALKKEYLLGAVEPPKIISDVFIDRGSNSTFDKNLKLGEIRMLDDLDNYGNGFFKIKNN